MYLLFLITILSFLIAFTKKIIQPIQKILLQDSSHVSSLKKELVELKKDLAKTPMKENYIEYVKIERKITKVEKSLAEIFEEESGRRNLVQYGLNYGFKTLLGMSLFFIVVFNRNEPVIIFSERFNLSPFSNAISTPIWVFVNNFVFRQLASDTK